jgi:hypothetical protein
VRRPAPPSERAERNEHLFRQADALCDLADEKQCQSEFLPGKNRGKAAERERAGFGGASPFVAGRKILAKVLDFVAPRD